jgi:multicomponent Na+:H+ antiporter subunit D
LSTLAPLVVAVPLLTAALIAAAGRIVGGRLADVLTLAATLGCAGLCLAILLRLNGGIKAVWLGGWHPRDGVAIGVSFTLDPVGVGLALFIAALMALVLIYGRGSLDPKPPHVHVLALVFLAGMVGFCLSGDLFNLFVFFELMSVSAFALTGLDIEEGAAVEGSLNFAVTNTIGSFLAVIGIALIYARTGALNLAQAGHVLDHARVDGLVAVALAFLVCGFLVKAAIVPFHLWLADAYAVAPTPICIVLAGAMSELGVLGVVRVLGVFDGPVGAHEEAVRAVLVVAGLSTAVLGAVMAFAQDHLKRMLAFVTIAHVGLFLAGVGVLASAGTGAVAVYVVADGCAKAALFACVGIVQRRLGHVSEARLRGAGRELRFTGAAFTIGALVLTGLPLTGPFLGKALLDDALMHDVGWPAVAIASAVAALTGATLLRAAGAVFLGWGEDEDHVSAEPELLAEPQPSTPVRMWGPTAALLAGAIAAGLVPGVRHAAHVAGTQATAHEATIHTVLGGAPAPAVHGALPAPPGHDWLIAIATLAAAFALAAHMLGHQRIGQPSLARIARRPLDALHALHSGRLGDYVALLCAGAALFGGAFALALGAGG